MLDHVGPLWEKTRDYHRDISLYFCAKFASIDFKTRKTDLLNKSTQGKLNIILAKDADTDIGYCVSTINRENICEIDSVYVEPSYRRQGVAGNLVKAAADWMTECGVKSKMLCVAVGNEDVIEFYKTFNFYPYQIILEEKVE